MLDTKIFPAVWSQAAVTAESKNTLFEKNMLIKKIKDSTFKKNHFFYIIIPFFFFKGI